MCDRQRKCVANVAKNCFDSCVKYWPIRKLKSGLRAYFVIYLNLSTNDLSSFDRGKMDLTDQQKAELILIHASGESLRASCDELKRRHPNIRKPAPMTVKNLTNKFSNTGSVSKSNKRVRGRPKTTRDVENRILSIMSARPQTSIRKLAQQVNLSRCSVHKTLHRLGLHPFRFSKVQALKEDDYCKRLSFSLWFSEQLRVQPTLPTDIMYTDEAVFYLHGAVNTKNRVYWANENPRVTLDVHHSYNPKVLVWCGMHGNTIIGPYFFDGTVDGKAYLHLLQSFLKLYLESLDATKRVSMYFQQDGASAHYMKSVRTWLTGTFAEQWIGRGGPVNWPARSPDLTPLDFFLWNRLKSVVYEHQPTSLNHLKRNIVEAVQNIRLEEVQRVHENIVKRVDNCITVDGKHFEHLM